MNSTVKIGKDGTQYWSLDGLLHRTNGPAVESAYGRQWLLNGQLHRTDGPAVEYNTGTRYWLIHNQLHRTDGPAIEYYDGTCEWWLNDQQYSFSKWAQALVLNDQEKTLLALKYTG